jgi:hypothetical protein
MPTFTAFITAFIVTYYNIYNSDKLHNYFFLIYRHYLLLLYCLVYGGIGIGLFLLTKKSNVFDLDSSHINIPAVYLTALGVGISTKGVADITLFSIKYSGQSTPFGLKTISRQIDGLFDNFIEPVCFERMTDFIGSYQDKYAATDLSKLKLRIVDCLAAYPNREKVAAFAEELNKAATSKEVLESLLREFGKATLRTINDKVPAVL